MTSQEPASGEQSLTPFVSLRSYRGFEKYLASAERMKVVSYCTSPRMILELFEEHGLTELEVIVGEKTDFREEIKSVNVARELEQYKRNGDLLIYLSPDRDIHAKLYILEDEHGEITILSGSPNFTDTAWTGHYQVNCLDVFTCDPGSEWDQRALDLYSEYRELCDDAPFLEDLTQELENSDDPPEEIIERWLAVSDVEDENEVQEFHGKITDRLGELGPDVDAKEAIHESLQKYSDKTHSDLQELFGDFDITINDMMFRSSIGEYGRAVEINYDLPKCWITPDAVHLITSAGTHIHLTEPLPKPHVVDAGLANIEAYIETVDFAETDDAGAAKAHMYEAVLYFFWAPFVNQYAKAFGAGRVNDVEKSVPFLYIHGEPNAGKGTFLEFALRLISDNTVLGPIDGATVGSRTPNTIREPVTAFPVAFDDLERQLFDRLGRLRNYWDSWDGKLFPAVIITSNENKPKKWFLQRSKMLHFKLMFSGQSQARMQMREIVEEKNPIYKWFTHLYLQREFQMSDLVDDETGRDDILAIVRKTVKDLYEFADRSLPPYFPERPAEWEHDVGRQRWLEAIERNYVRIKRRNDRFVATFDSDITPYEINNSYLHNLPKHIRARRAHNDVWITSDEAFEQWLQREIPTGDGLGSKIKSYLPFSRHNPRS
ncbi:phospholipase D family protein [Salinibaculum salinum]|uniref:phospholipase D family protein n=1 Tax=Salinibaculum salinum TaxID=3131996 RepID=UPI0030EEADA6